MATVVARLADHPGALPVLERLFESEWADYYGPKGPGDARRDLLAYSNHDGLPLGLVAFVDGEPCGIAVLKAESIPALPQLSPWASAGLVAPGCRRRGIGARLIAALEAQARAMGYCEIHSATNTANSLLERLGWDFVARVPHEEGTLAVYRKALQARTPGSGAGQAECATAKVRIPANQHSPATRARPFKRGTPTPARGR